MRLATRLLYPYLLNVASRQKLKLLESWLGIWPRAVIDKRLALESMTNQ